MNETKEVETEEVEAPTEEQGESPAPDSSEIPSKKPINPKVLGGIAGAVAVMGLCFSFLGGSNTSAEEMRLEKYFGDITLQNTTENKAVVEGSRLVSQDNLETFTESSAYISLDRVKALKLDEDSHMEVVKVDDDLDIELYKGSLYFSVTKPLAEDETLEFHTNNVVTGVRGTSGVITYTEDILQSQVVVLSGTVEVVTIEEEPKTVLVNQGEIAIATTQEDGSVTLEVREQEKTPTYLFSTHFLDDSGEDVEECIVLPWKEAYAQHLGEIESCWTGEIFQHNFTKAPSFMYNNYDGKLNSWASTGAEFLDPVDLTQTTYWLHDMDLDGTPELFVNYSFTSKGTVTFDEYGVIGNFGTEITAKESSIDIYCFRGSGYSYLSSFQVYEVDSRFYSPSGSLSQHNIDMDFLAIPPDGYGIYRQTIGDVYSGDKLLSHFERTIDLTTKNGFQIGLEYYELGIYNEGTPIDTSTWTNYTDLSGLEWNG